jgi:hypothetical protein
MGWRLAKLAQRTATVPGGIGRKTISRLEPVENRRRSAGGERLRCESCAKRVLDNAKLSRRSVLTVSEIGRTAATAADDADTTLTRSMALNDASVAAVRFNGKGGKNSRMGCIADTAVLLRNLLVLAGALPLRWYSSIRPRVLAEDGRVGDFPVCRHPSIRNASAGQLPEQKSSDEDCIGYRRPHEDAAFSGDAAQIGHCLRPSFRFLSRQPKDDEAGMTIATVNAIRSAAVGLP